MYMKGHLYDAPCWFDAPSIEVWDFYKSFINSKGVSGIPKLYLLCRSYALDGRLLCLSMER
jgi:hypothetical protein